MNIESIYKYENKLILFRFMRAMQMRFWSQNGKAYINDGSVSLMDCKKFLEASSVVDRGNEWNESEYDLDVIVPVYNTGKYLEECIESVLKQKTSYDYRIIIVNDGSSDNTTLALLRKYKKNKIVSVLDKENGGISSARDMAIDVSKGRYLMMLDSDDILLPNAIELLLSKACTTNADIVEGGYIHINENGKALKTYMFDNKEMSWDSIMGYPWAKVYKRCLFKSVQYIVGLKFEDAGTKPLIAAQGDKIIRIDQLVYGYRRNRKSESFMAVKSADSLDSYWITRMIDKDRRRLGIEDSQEYYEYILDMIRITYRRNVNLVEKYQMCLFGEWCKWINYRFADYHTVRQEYVALEDALTNKNFKLYKVWGKYTIR